MHFGVVNLLLERPHGANEGSDNDFTREIVQLKAFGAYLQNFKCLSLRTVDERDTFMTFSWYANLSYKGFYLDTFFGFITDRNVLF